MSAPRVTDVTVDAPFTHSTGPGLSRFLTALRDDAVIWGRRCRGCDRVVVPAADHCETCAGVLDEWIEVGPGGVVTDVTLVTADMPLTRLEPPFAVVKVRLDGADTDLVHLAPDPDGITRGARVEASWSDVRTGTIRDLAGFRLEGSGGGHAHDVSERHRDRVTVVERRLDLPFRQTAGTLTTRFQDAIRDGEIRGNRCTTCGLVYVPPAPHCAKCWALCDGWETIADTGTVTTYVVVNVPFFGQEIAIPYVLAHVLLDGADAAIYHLVGTIGADGTLVLPLDGVRRGMRVRAVWRDPDDRHGYINDDIDHFEPIAEPDVPVAELTS
ncbi:MAG: OB-fold domain-containing protein [Actinobacteria bacterium]|nr:OB-fold domain-containing protein [Actinomycetota bacterium]